MSNFFMAVLAFLVTHSTAVVLAILGLILVVGSISQNGADKTGCVINCNN
jgi:hypothetical protein